MSALDTSQIFYNWAVGISAGVFVALQGLAKLWPHLKAFWYRFRFPVQKQNKTYEIVQLKGKEGILYTLKKNKLRWISSSLTRSDLHFPYSGIKTLDQKDWDKYSVGSEVYTRGQRGK